jgi:hypothetical protein
VLERRWFWLGLPVLLVLADWKLGLSLTSGAGVAWLLFGLPRARWQAALRSVQRQLPTINRRFLLAAAGGGLTTLVFYLTTAIWAEEGRPWLALGTLMEGLGLVAVMALLLGALQERNLETPATFDRLLERLIHPDALERLLAVRMLQRVMGDRQLTPYQEQLALDALQLLALKEAEPAVRGVVLDCLAQSRPVLAPLQLPSRPNMNNP